MDLLKVSIKKLIESTAQAKNFFRNEVLQYAAEHYGVSAEYLWMKAPGYAVLRREDNQKWYAVIRNVQREQLGLTDGGYVDILELKWDPMMSGSLLFEKGFLPAYRMHRGNWITVLLDGSVDMDRIFSLLDMSFELTANRTSRKKSRRSVNREWLIPANPKYYDVEKEFARSDTILWKQSSNVIVGDIIYLYFAAPVSQIQYKCKAVEVDIPYQYDDGNIRINRAMKIQLLHRFQKGQLDFHKLNEHGVYAVRGPRGVPNGLHYEIEALCGEPSAKDKKE